MSNLNPLHNNTNSSLNTTPIGQSSTSSASTPYSFASTSHKPPNIPRSNLTSYNFQNLYNQQFQFHHQQNDQFLTYSHDSAAVNPNQQQQSTNTDPTMALQPNDLQQITSPISAQNQQPPSHPPQGILLSPAISNNLQYVHQSYLPPPSAAPPQQIQISIPNTNINPALSNSLIAHRRTRVFWSRRDMDNLITWIERNKPDCIGHGRRQDCERIKKEVFATRTEFTPKTIKEKLLNMKKKYRQARLLINENENIMDTKSEDEHDNNDENTTNQDDEKSDLGFNNPRFEGLSLKDRVEKICPFFDRIDRLKTQAQNQLTKPFLLQTHLSNQPLQHETENLTLNDQKRKRSFDDVSTQDLISILEQRDGQMAQEFINRFESDKPLKNQELKNLKVIENVIKTVLPNFFSANGGSNHDITNIVSQSISNQIVEPLSLSKSLESLLNSHETNKASTNNIDTHINNNTIVASALAAAVSSFMTTIKLGYGILEKRPKVVDSLNPGFNFQSVSSNDDLSLQIPEKFNQI